ncbi:MAG: pyridoxamine 5'-phosphate oxidase [Phycisphaerae bacterium]|nr:pyridoxamine 5'-phosphate oxidase [Phycisphaerae bacterium]
MDKLPQMRADYHRGELRREDLRADPLEQFQIWFSEACDARLPEPNAMSLATVGPDGQPSLRTVLLKGCDRNGFVFFTNLESRKARELAANPRAALLFAWLPLERQVIITGEARRISTAESLRYFLARPRDSQIAAWSSPQSRPIPSRAFLEQQWQKMKQRFGEGQIPLPDFWGGFRVFPRQIEFWQGRPNRLHDRFLYTRQPDDHWTIEQLAP